MPETKFNLAKILISIGALFVLLGLIVWALEKVGGNGIFSRLGKLPGDIRIERGNFHFYFPWVTCLVLSGLLTLVFQILRRLGK